MFAFVLLGVLAATVLVLPKSNHELLDLDEWSFWMVHMGSTIVGKIRQEDADDTGVDTESETESNAEQCDTSAFSLIQRRWKIFFQRKSSAAARVQRWWRRRVAATAEEASSEESYQLVEHADCQSSGDEESDEDVSKASDADVSASENSDDEGDDESDDEGDDESDDDESDDNASDVSADFSADFSVDKDDCDWCSVRNRGFGAFSDDVLSGLEGRDRIWAKVGLSRLRRNFRWTWADSAWMFFTRKGRTPPSVLDTCPDHVRARLFAPHVWLSNDPYFVPSEIEWTRSVRRWTRR